MIWQDIVIMIVCYGFGFALIPSIRSASKPALWTSFLTGLGLVVIAVCFVTLGLWLSFISEVFAATMWFILYVQKVRGG